MAVNIIEIGPQRSVQYLSLVWGIPFYYSINEKHVKCNFVSKRTPIKLDYLANCLPNEAKI